VRATEDYLHKLQSGDAAGLAALYDRASVRYENGMLAPLTRGKPLTMEQQMCVNNRVATSYEITHFTRSWEHRAASVAMKFTHGLEAPLDVLVTVEWNRHNCKVSNEHFFYATDHAGYMYYLEQTQEDCFGDEVDVGGPMDNLAHFRSCWNSLATGEANNFYSCVQDAEVTLNGVRMSNYGPDFWVKLLDEVSFNNVRHDVTQNRDQRRVYSITTGSTTANGVGKDFAIGQSVKFEQSGDIAKIDLVFLDSAFSHIVTGTGNDATFPTTWTNSNAETAFLTTAAVYDAPEVFENLAGGFAQFSGNPTIRDTPVLSCLDHVVVRDESVFVPQVLPVDQKDHVEQTYAYLVAGLSDDQRSQIQKVSRSIFYDALRSMIIARGDTLGATTAQLRLALKVARGELTLADAQSMVGADIAATIATEVDGSYRTDEEDGYQYTAAFITQAQELCGLAAALP
jgi:hypothetical protein